MSEISKYIDQYKAPDFSVLYHEDDESLKPIRLSLPRPPKAELIDGYGLEPKKQKFKVSKVPDKLVNLERIALDSIKEKAETDASFTATLYKVQEEYWRILSTKRDYYSEEISWIKKTWWHIINGYWFYNNGKPTYITGWHYQYLNFWHIDGQFLPDYRDRDRKEFLFFHYAYTATETFEKLDKNGVAVPEDDGSYKMIDLGKRICYGVGQNKNRRSGNTNKGLLIVWNMTTTHRGTDGGGIMSMSGDSSEEHMKQKMIPAWKKMPMFMRPITQSNNDPKSIVNKAPRTEIGADELNNKITSAGTSEAGFYDGKKLWAILVDESGKSKNLDVRERTSVLQHCIAQGNGSIIFGFMYQPSTAEEMSKGGKAYKGLLEDSSFYKRNEITGQTRSGMFRLFMPADEALDGFIDEYGFSVKGKKLSKEHKDAGFRHTATQVLLAEREQLIRDSKTDPDAMVKYRSVRKQFPLSYDDSWIGNAGDIGFDLDILDRRLADLSRMESPTQRGNFEWAGMEFRSAVVWRPDPLNGKWYLSKILRGEETNQKYKDYEYDSLKGCDIEVYRPKYFDRFTIGADPFNFKKESEVKIAGRHGGGRHSDGGIAVFWHRDYREDPEDKNVREWESNRFVCTYRYRESDNIKYAEDVLKTCLYFSSPCFPENNIPIVAQKFHEWGYDGFLKYQIDPKTMKRKDYPGVQSLERSKQEGFSEIRNHISLHGHKEMHEDLLTEWKNIASIEEMTKYDLLAASMCALLGSKSIESDMYKEEEDITYDLGTGFFF